MAKILIIGGGGFIGGHLAQALVRDGEQVDIIDNFSRAVRDPFFQELEKLENAILRALLPKDPRDDHYVIVEIRAGAGGQEAALFASNLYRLYVRYSERQNWKTSVINISEAAMGGFKEVTFSVEGKGAFSRLKYESGVHRVQRVPETETQGRIHTSTATVAVLPEAEDVDIEMERLFVGRIFFFNKFALYLIRIEDRF